MSASATSEPTGPDEQPTADDGRPDAEPRPAGSRLRRVLVGVSVLLVLSLVAAVTFAVVTVRAPLPEVSGTQTVPGLHGEVTVHRDEQGVPHVYASEAQDLFAAQGYLHAQDRFFQMDYRRHVTAGRLAELVGDVPEAVQADQVIRTFGWRQVAEQEWDLVSPETRAYLQAYAQGVNAYLADRGPDDLGVEYTVLGTRVDVADPDPWDPVDSLAWLKAMAWDLRGNYDDELDRALAYSTVEDVDLVDELFPTFADGGNTPILAEDELADPQLASDDAAPASTAAVPYGSGLLDEAVASAREALAAVPVLVGRGEGSGSNSWVVSGDHTASGAPILANDPHLSLEIPGIWSQVGLHCQQVDESCPFDVAGFGFAGFPGVVIGHNEDLAWGLTNMGADVTDFYIERVRDDTWLQDAEDEVWKPMEVRTETIRVNGGEAVELEVRSTDHGPVMSSVLDVGEVVGTPTETGTGFGEYAVSLAWTALEPGRTADAIFAMATAADAGDVQQAAALFDVPAQNIVFATTDGHIGYQAPGRIPVREQVAGPVPSDGTWPRPGWDPSFDWQGYVDPADMPRALDPESGFVVAANQAVLPAGTGPHLTSDWDPGFRSERIRTLLTEQISAGRPFTVADMERIQQDDHSPFAELLVPVLLEVEIPDAYDAAGQELLAGWDYSTGTDSAAAAYFNAVWRNLLAATFHDDLPPQMAPSGGARWLVVVRDMLQRPDDPFWDDRSTVGVVETRDEALLRALVTARRDLTVELSKDPADWNWGSVHELSLQHPVLGGDDVPALVRDYVNPRPVPMPGGSSIVNATAWDASTGDFAVTAGPSMRMVVDLADLDASTWVTATGVSGHPASAHYGDQLETWAAGESFPFPFTRDAVEGSAEETATLVP